MISPLYGKTGTNHCYHYYSKRWKLEVIDEEKKFSLVFPFSRARSRVVEERGEGSGSKGMERDGGEKKADWKIAVHGAGLSLAARLQRNRASFFLHYESRQGIIVAVFTKLFGTKGLHRVSHSRIPFISRKTFRPWAARLCCLYALLELLSLLTKHNLSSLASLVFTSRANPRPPSHPPLLVSNHHRVSTSRIHRVSLSPD